jgi:dethiobiotin synthetase|tara:strand:- start:22227 stop:22877 length:651 start_codon:yes stop_codon:yes gene_type:complete
VNLSKTLFISGISTDVGKTVVSAILAEALESNYWKPVQAGDLDNSDSLKIRRYCSEKVTILDERFRLSQPMSPHAAAEIDQVNIEVDDFQTPMVEGSLVIEGAGGLMVPLNSKGLLVVDLIQKNNWPVVLVSRHYLGSINHTLLSIEVLKKRNIEIAGIVFVGDENKSTESIIANKGVVDIWGRVPLANEVTREFISDQAKIWTNNEFLKKYKTKI